MESHMERFMEGFAYTAYEYDMEMKSTRQLEDGFTEIVVNNRHEPDEEFSIDIKEAGEFNGSNMLAVRTFQGDEQKERIAYISAIPYVLFGMIYV